jgi:hypothetical protein
MTAEPLLEVAPPGAERSTIPPPVLWPGGTVVVMATGPSLTREDVEYCRGRVDGAIAVNCAYLFAPWAEVLYGTDGLQFWAWYPEARAFPGLRYCLTDNPYGIATFHNTGDAGLERDPTGLRSGQNSAYAAINLAVHMGARRIVLLGVDAGRGPRGLRHAHPDHPTSSRADLEPNYFLMRHFFPTLVAPLAEAGVEVVNCSRSTRLECFPCRPLAEVLP